MLDIKKILIEVSNRHVHLSGEDMGCLFGEGCKLNSIRNLSQPNQFVCSEKVHLIGLKGVLKDVRVLGPERDKTQIEVLKSDLDVLGFKVPFRHSGDLEDSPGVEVRGPNGRINLEKGVIISHTHLHASEEEAEELGLKNGDKVNLKIKGTREFILENIFVRKGEGHKLAVHIDKDIGKELGIDRVDYGELV